MTPPPPYGGPVYGQSAGGGGFNTRLLLIGVGVLVVVLLIVGLVIFLGDDEAEAGEIFLDPAGETGRDPFTNSVSVDGQDVGISAQIAGGGGGGDSIEVVSAPGSDVGLYGGTENQSTCDRDQLIDFLTSDREKGRAWADVHGISTDEIEDFIRDLTPLRLRFDTRVTNHGFRDGRANAYQTVLQAGTAVLVDDRGVPRVRCACGNPLLEPTATSGSPRFRGDRWAGFSPTNFQRVTIVEQTINIFVVTNIDTGDRFNRPAGTDGSDDTPVDDQPPDDDGTTTTTSPPTTDPPTTEGPVLGTGDVQVTLRWSTDADLDLHVIDPNGEEISFAATTSSSGGQLDVDCIPSAGCSDDGNHVENVFWPTGSAPSGTYSAFVRNLGDTSDFSLEIIVGGESIGGDGGSLAAGASSTPVEFTVSS